MLRIHLDRINRAKLPDFLRLVYLVGLTAWQEGRYIVIGARHG